MSKKKLCECLFDTILYGTSYTDVDVTFNMELEKDEKIIFFALDGCKKNTFLSSNDGKRCDLMVVYIKKNKEKVICFIELKKGSTEGADKQIKDAIKRLQEFKIIPKNNKIYRLALGNVSSHSNSKRNNKSNNRELYVRSTTDALVKHIRHMGDNGQKF
ncbi:MAG: hypothetical protein L3V56_05920 [Candidatus Magnetoovum sp. WYHC-5]|nr:hypothetical protein [Candidatus Magnetoovum sp. WYHC-5]